MAGLPDRDITNNPVFLRNLAKKFSAKFDGKRETEGEGIGDRFSWISKGKRVPGGRTSFVNALKSRGASSVSTGSFKNRDGETVYWAKLPIRDRKGVPIQKNVRALENLIFDVVM